MLVVISVNLFGVGIMALKSMFVNLREVEVAVLSGCSMTGVGLLSVDALTRVASDGAPTGVLSAHTLTRVALDGVLINNNNNNDNNNNNNNNNTIIIIIIIIIIPGQFIKPRK